MRIAAISDIHARPDGLDDDLIQAIRQRVEELSPDIFIIAGDLSEEIIDLEHNLRVLALPRTTNLYVAGNHDVWFEEDLGLGSLEKYSKTIGEVCKKSGFMHLPDELHIQDDIAFVGSMVWYDYSFKRDDLDIPEENYIEKEWKGSVWRDYYAIDWPYTDKEATSLFDSKLNYDLETLPKDIRKVIFVSHHLPFRDLTLYKDYLPWDFFSAFMGSVSTGEILREDNRVILTISGHSHIRRRHIIDEITAITVPLGYGRPNQGKYSSLVNDAIAIIEIEDGAARLEHFVEGDICEGLPYIF
ncbi:MAG: metallophosphoesterase [Candidatus Thorarchaeota archaeon]